jgi:hypothetical protein
MGQSDVIEIRDALVRCTIQMGVPLQYIARNATDYGTRMRPRAAFSIYITPRDYVIIDVRPLEVTVDVILSNHQIATTYTWIAVDPPRKVEVILQDVMGHIEDLMAHTKLDSFLQDAVELVK